jgi:hypothetical protein
LIATAASSKNNASQEGSGSGILLGSRTSLDFVRVGKGYPELTDWAMQWLSIFAGLSKP